MPFTEKRQDFTPSVLKSAVAFTEHMVPDVCHTGELSAEVKLTSTLPHSTWYGPDLDDCDRATATPSKHRPKTSDDQKSPMSSGAYSARQTPSRHTSKTPHVQESQMSSSDSYMPLPTFDEPSLESASHTNWTTVKRRRSRHKSKTGASFRGDILTLLGSEGE